MSEPTLNYVWCPDASGGHRMAYWQWGEAAHPHVIVCAHGLSRQGRDFDTLARALCNAAPEGVRVICPDVAGRGRSDWLKDPMGYQIPGYAADMLALLAQVQPQRLDWVGTSMGGLIGMVLAGQPDLPLPARIDRLVLNDVGPAIQWLAIQRIGTYLGKAGTFPSLQHAADAMLAVSQGFGPHTPEQWMDLSRAMVRPVEGGAPGEVGLHYDPDIAVPFRQATEESIGQGQAMMWQIYDAIKARTLLLRGADSDLLSRETAQAMTQRGPKAKLVEFEGVGHAPTLIAQEQVDAVTQFLFGPQG
jgi:pimeloyl-ACP methyl ester carboxylesterase